MQILEKTRQRGLKKQVKNQGDLKIPQFMVESMKIKKNIIYIFIYIYIYHDDESFCSIREVFPSPPATFHCHIVKKNVCNMKMVIFPVSNHPFLPNKIHPNSIPPPQNRIVSLEVTGPAQLTGPHGSTAPKKTDESPKHLHHSYPQIAENGMGILTYFNLCHKFRVRNVNLNMPWTSQSTRGSSP